MTNIRKSDIDHRGVTHPSDSLVLHQLDAMKRDREHQLLEGSRVRAATTGVAGLRARLGGRPSPERPAQTGRARGTCDPAPGAGGA